MRIMPLVLLSANLLVTMATSPDLPVLDEKLAIDLKPTPHSLAEQVERAYNAFFTSPDYQKTESTSNIAQMMKSSLEPIFERLRSFTRGAEFNYMEFDSIVDPLAEELQIISDYVERAKDINQELFKRLTFTKHVMSIMKISSAGLKFYILPEVDHILVRKLAHINVRLLSLYGPDGVPDISKFDYTTTVHTITRNLNSAVRVFSFLVDVPLNVGVMFQTQLVQARSTLSEVTSYIPVEKRPPVWTHF